MELKDLELIVYDFEVFAHDWMVCFKREGSGEHVIIWNDNAALCEYMEEREDSVFVGYNSKHYDQYIAKAIVAGCTPEEVKEVNDFIIGSGEVGWKHPYLKDCYFKFNNTDLMDDVQKGTSLKSIEGHLGMSVEESTVDFTITTKLTDEQRKEVEHYCKHDVDATEKLLDIRRDYLQTKLNLAERADISAERALSLTNAKLTSVVLGAERKEHNDERDYKYPDNLRKEFIPQEVLDFFNKLHDESVPDDELFKSKLEIMVGDCPVTVGFGGIHGAIPCYKEVVA